MGFSVQVYRVSGLDHHGIELVVLQLGGGDRDLIPTVSSVLKRISHCESGGDHIVDTLPQVIHILYSEQRLGMIHESNG